MIRILEILVLYLYKTGPQCQKKKVDKKKEKSKVRKEKEGQRSDQEKKRKVHMKEIIPVKKLKIR